MHLSSHIFFSPNVNAGSVAKITRSKIKTAQKKHCDIGDSNQTWSHLKIISEYCEHLTDDVVLNIV